MFRIRFPELPDFLSSSGFRTGSTQPREYNWPPLWSSGQSSWLQIQRSRLRFQGTTRQKKIVGLERGPLSLVSTTDRMWDLVVRVPGYISRCFEFDSRRYQIFGEVVGLERGPLSLVSTNEKLLKRKSSGSGLESQEYGRRDSSRWPRDSDYSFYVLCTVIYSDWG
jgi:hypothetical protein